jgi:hypothetical protein
VTFGVRSRYALTQATNSKCEHGDGEHETDDTRAAGRNGKRINASQRKAEADRDEIKAKMDSYQGEAGASMAKLLEDKMDSKMDSYQEKAEANVATLEKIEEILESQMEHLIVTKWNTHQETTENDPDSETMQSAVEH